MGVPAVRASNDETGPSLIGPFRPIKSEFFREPRKRFGQWAGKRFRRRSGRGRFEHRLIRESCRRSLPLVSCLLSFPSRHSMRIVISNLFPTCGGDGRLRGVSRTRGMGMKKEPGGAKREKKVSRRDDTWHGEALPFSFAPERSDARQEVPGSGAVCYFIPDGRALGNFRYSVGFIDNLRRLLPGFPYLDYICQQPGRTRWNVDYAPNNGIHSTFSPFRSRAELVRRAAPRGIKRIFSAIVS